MKLSDFDYNLPKELIAQSPMKPRDHSRLLILDKKKGAIEHKNFFNILDYLKKGDIVVLNNSKVFPARLIGKKIVTGGKLEVFLLQKLEGNKWKCLLGGRGTKIGLEVEFKKELKCKVVKDNDDGTWEIKFNKSHKETIEIVEKIGRVPLPPYIESSRKSKVESQKPWNDKISYQTVYADDKKVGSVAAPTAGLHFTPTLINKLKKKGVQFECVTLHVGLGTFAPVKTDNIKKHKMHAEFVEIKKSAAARINKAKKEGRRVIAVGTTSVRTLESLLPKNKFSDWTDIFIYSGYKFKVVDAMITNFHLPKSTLLMLISAFAGKRNIDRAYKEAIKKKYRFYSYGDAMFIG